MSHPPALSEEERQRFRAQAFIATVNAHAISARPYGRSMAELIDIVMVSFDKHFPPAKVSP